MKKGLLKIMSIISMISITSSVQVFATEKDKNTDIVSAVKTDQVIENNSELRSPTYDYAWEVTSKTVYNNTFGEWRIGPTGTGPGSLSINDSTTISRSFTNTISGSYPAGKKTIGASLGVSIGVSNTHGTSYTITLGNNEKKTIKFRPKIKVYKVVQTKYKYNLENGRKTAMDTQVCYVNVFDSWDYNWVWA